MDTTPTPPVTNTPAPVSATPTPTKPPALDPATLAKQKQASYGAIFIIVLILVMIVVGAFYAWGKRIALDQVPATTSGAAQ